MLNKLDRGYKLPFDCKCLGECNGMICLQRDLGYEEKYGGENWEYEVDLEEGKIKGMRLLSRGGKNILDGMVR